MPTSGNYLGGHTVSVLSFTFMACYRLKPYDGLFGRNSMAYKLKVVNGALDELNGSIVLRGVIDPSCFGDVKVGAYQREEARASHIAKLVKALNSGARFPDIEIGIRGNNYRERDGAFYVEHECFVVDGFQRLTAAKRFMAEDLKNQVHIGALLHFGTTEDWERERFKTLNMDRARVSPNVILRNEVDSSVVKALRSMSENDKEFVLRSRISWGQRMSRGELLGALLVMKTIGVLHTHSGPGIASRVEDLVASMDKTLNIVGANVWRANVRTFFSVLDQAFGVRTIAYRDLSAHIRGGFMFTLARVFADHQTFWDGQRLEVARHDVEKLRAFPIRDPGICAVIANSNSKANPLLYARLMQHMNSGRRSRKILKWDGQPASEILVDPSSGSTETEDDSGDTEGHSCRAA